MWRLAMLMGNCINEGFYKKMCGCFAGSKKVAVLPRWPLDGVPGCIRYFKFARLKVNVSIKHGINV